MSTHVEHCTFCDLIQGAAEVSVCHEDADSIAFMDIQPVNAGHVLVVPRAHYNSLLDVPPELGTHLFRVTMRLAGAIRKVTGCDDLNIVVNSGAAAGQDEPHYHVHIIPRRLGDGFEINLPFGGSQMPDRTVLDAVAVQLIAAMRDPMKAQRQDIPTAEMLSATTVKIPAEEFAKMAASTGETSGPRRTVPVIGDVVVKSAEPGVTSGDPARRGAWRVNEGPHGELLYGKRDVI